MGEVIVLFKNLAFVGDTGQNWATDWIPIPAGNQKWQLVFIVKSRIGGSLGSQLQTTWDTDTASNVSGAVATLNAVGTTIIDITSGMGPMVRVFFTPGASTQLMVSGYLTAKSD